MKYPRPPYQDPGVRTFKSRGMMGMPGTELPVPDYPISMKENFRRLARRDHPLWITNSATEMNFAMHFMLTGAPEADFSRTGMSLRTGSACSGSSSPRWAVPC